MDFLVRFRVGARAALGIIEGRGVGRVRHLDVGSLWIQEQQLGRIIELKKVAGLLTPGDLSTKNLCIELVDTYSDIIGLVFAEGRASATSRLNSRSGHRAARRNLLALQTSGQPPLTSGSPDVSVRGELPAMFQGESR